MRGRRQTFSEALEEALDTARDGTPDTSDRFVYLPATAAPFVFVYSRTPRPTDPAPAVRRDAANPRVRAAYAQPAVHAPAAQPGQPPRPSGTLTGAEARAVDEMIQLGAQFQHGFTARDLRREYRRLAREYHPDCHPGHTAAEQERLAQIFAALTEHYRTLMAAFERQP